MQFDVIRRISAVCLVALTTAGVLHAQEKSEESFDIFFQRFKVAVQQRDEPALSKLMSPNFQFLRVAGVSPEDVFKGLDADNGRGWGDLQKAISASGPVSFAKPNGNRRQVLQCTPSGIIYSCLITFEPDEHNQWRWTGMIMPMR